MKTFRNIALLLIGFMAPTIFAAAPDIADLPYEKRITFESISTPTAIELIMDESVMDHTNEKFSNFDIFDENNAEVHFDLLLEDFQLLEGMKVIETSSQKAGDPNALVDGDSFTSFAFDESVDGPNPSWAIIDLGKPTPLLRVQTLLAMNQKENVTHIEIRAGLNRDRLKTVVSKRDYQYQIDFNTDLARYMKISFWGESVTIDDLKITGGKKATAYFEAQPDKQYRVLYGGNQVDLIRYKSRLQSPKPGAVQGILLKEKWNDSFPDDVDKDGIPNEEDNCPFHENSKQKDKDRDRVGDVCDNAPETRNTNQKDTDGDGIADVVDNCRLEPNPEQSDLDEDGFGDACDNANIEDKNDESITKTIKRTVFGDAQPSLGVIAGIAVGVIFVLVIVAGFWKRRRK